MEDSLKGVLVTITLIGLFMTCILNFIVLFPQEQGVTFSGGGQAGYLAMQNNTDSGNVNALSTINNQTGSALEQWDITVGFMGSNQLKQGQQGITSYKNNIFTTLQIIATQIFGANSPIIYAILVLLGLSTAYLVYQVIKFVRTGN